MLIFLVLKIDFDANRWAALLWYIPQSLKMIGPDSPFHNSKNIIFLKNILQNNIIIPQN